MISLGSHRQGFISIANQSGAKEINRSPWRGHFLVWGNERAPGARSFSFSRKLKARELAEGTVEKVLAEYGYNVVKTSGDWCNVEVCVQEVCCGTPEQVSGRAKAGNVFSFGVRRREGSYNCFRCDAKGNWFNLCRSLGAVVDEDSFTPTTSPLGGGAVSPHEPKTVPHTKLTAVLERYPDALLQDTQCEARRWLAEDLGFTLETLQRFSVGAAKYALDQGDQPTRLCVTFPLLAASSAPRRQVVRVKAVAVGDPSRFVLDPPRSPSETRGRYGGVGADGVFGWGTVLEEDTVRSRSASFFRARARLCILVSAACNPIRRASLRGNHVSVSCAVRHSVTPHFTPHEPETGARF